MRGQTRKRRRKSLRPTKEREVTLVAEMVPAMQEEEMLVVATVEAILRAATAVEETIQMISGALLAVAKRRRRKRRTLGEFHLMCGFARPLLRFL
jgi:hypothetical protein